MPLGIGKEELVLPEEFDGVFHFTNPTKDDFVGKFDGKEYVFEAFTTSPIIISEATLIEIQSIRKRWARELAQREFFQTEKVLQIEEKEKIGDAKRTFTLQGGWSYGDNDYAEFIQKCLDPMKKKTHIVRKAPKEDIKKVLHRDENDKIITKPVGAGKSKEQLREEFEGSDTELR